MEVEMVITKNAGKTQSKRVKQVWVKGESNEDFDREKALWGRTCEEPTPMPQQFKFKEEGGMTHELQHKLNILDAALEGNQDEELSHYLIEKILGMADEPESIKIIEDFEAKYFN